MMQPSVSDATSASSLPTIRALFLEPLVRELTSGGLDADELLRRHGICAFQANRPYERIPLRGFVALEEEAADKLSRPFLGLELGQTVGLAEVGPFCVLLGLAGTLGEALGYLARFNSVLQTHTTLEMRRGAKCSELRYVIREPTIWPHRQDSESTLASLCAMIRQLTSRQWRPLEVHFEHSIDDRAPRLREFFRSPVTGNATVNAMVVANEIIDRPLTWNIGSRDKVFQANFERHLLALLRDEPTDNESCTERAQSLVARRLGNGIVDIGSVATALNMSVRNLRRRLTSEGTSFRQILQEQRYARMKSVLAHGDAPLSALADRLSYSHSSALSRAFKTWTGVSPRTYAKSQR